MLCYHGHNNYLIGLYLNCSTTDLSNPAGTKLKGCPLPRVQTKRYTTIVVCPVHLLGSCCPHTVWGIKLQESAMSTQPTYYIWYHACIEYSQCNYSDWWISSSAPVLAPNLTVCNLWHAIYIVAVITLNHSQLFVKKHLQLFVKKHLQLFVVQNHIV